jgi:hypothetical protein
MRRIAALLTGIMLFAATAMAAGPKTYQVTGPVLELRDDAVVVQKGKEKWEISRDKDTKISGELKMGSKVTIMYSMKAASIENKEAAKVAPKKK